MPDKKTFNHLNALPNITIAKDGKINLARLVLNNGLEIVDTSRRTTDLRFRALNKTIKKWITKIQPIHLCIALILYVFGIFRVVEGDKFEQESEEQSLAAFATWFAPHFIAALIAVGAKPSGFEDVVNLLKDAGYEPPDEEEDDDKDDKGAPPEPPKKEDGQDPKNNKDPSKKPRPPEADKK